MDNLQTLNLAKVETVEKENININENKKRKHHRSSTKKHTVKSRKDKKHKTTKIKNTEE